MMTLAEAKAELEKWTVAYDVYKQEYSPIMNALANYKVQAGNAWLTKYREMETYRDWVTCDEDVTALSDLGNEMDFANFAYDNARQEYCAALHKLHIRREAARYYVEDLEASA